MQREQGEWREEEREDGRKLRAQLGGVSRSTVCPRGRGTDEESGMKFERRGDEDRRGEETRREEETRKEEERRERKKGRGEKERTGKETGKEEERRQGEKIGGKKPRRGDKERGEETRRAGMERIANINQEEAFIRVERLNYLLCRLSSAEPAQTQAFNQSVRPTGRA
ncbi:hypothetical protein JOQ06_017418, partial [Pogonophryne albipinna]